VHLLKELHELKTALFTAPREHGCRRVANLPSRISSQPINFFLYIGQVLFSSAE
jgi:hypothetical protein